MTIDLQPAVQPKAVAQPRPLRILQLCKKFPYPLKDGESIAVTHLSRAMRELGAEVTLLSMNTSKHYFDLQELPADFDHYQKIAVVAVDNMVKPKDALLNLFTKESYHVSRFISKPFAAQLAALLTEQDFDVVQLETLYLAPYIQTIRQNSQAAIVMRSHNVEFEIWERIANNCPQGPKKWYLQLLAKRLKTFETEQLSQYDGLVAITERDYQRFLALGFKGAAVVAPVGLDYSRYQTFGTSPASEEGLACGFIGSLDWLPNIEGITWFVEQVWDKLLKDNPTIHLSIAGRNTPTSLHALAKPNLHVLGEVPDALSFIASQEALLVPLFSGGGMRVKILEALAIGRVVITTDIGAEGIPGIDGEHFLIANDGESFARQIIRCAEQPELRKALSENAKRLARQHFSGTTIASNLLKFYRHTLLPERQGA